MIFETPLTINEEPILETFLKKYKKPKFANIVYEVNLRVYHRTLISEQQNMLCYWCKCEMTHERNKQNSTTIEHMTPKSKGGLDHPSNYTVSCAHCNNKRGTLSVHAFIALLSGDNKLANLERHCDTSKPDPTSNTSKRKARKLAMKIARELNITDNRPNFNDPVEVAAFLAKHPSLDSCQNSAIVLA